MESVDEHVALLNKCMSMNNINSVVQSLLMDISAKAQARGTKSDEDMFKIITEQELLWHRIVDAVWLKNVLTPDLFREAVVLTMPAVYSGWIAYITKGNGK